MDVFKDKAAADRAVQKLLSLSTQAYTEEDEVYAPEFNLDMPFFTAPYRKQQPIPQ